jgi:ubiquinone/menaquinone biosynthesis C-methylase UbiE
MIPAGRHGAWGHATRGQDEGVTEDTWAPLVGQFVDGHYGSLRGRVRTHVIDRHLHAHLPPPPAKLVDVGGGAGNQSVPLAREGYEITIVDPSAAMLERAEQLLTHEAPETAARVRLVQASAEQAPAIVGTASFAGVLCHGVIMYVEEPQPFLAALVELAEPQAIVSVVAKNADNLALRPALEGDWSTALASFGGDRQINGLGVETRADSLDELTEMLADVGVERIAWYGVRLFTDGWTPARASDDPEAAVLAVELEASRRDPYRLMSRLFHVVGRRR